MPKYYPFVICGYYLYFTSACVIEAFHVHASNKQLTESGSAKFWVYENGDIRVDKRGRLKDKDINKMIQFIKDHHHEMYDFWISNGGKPEHYEKRD